MGIVLLGPPGVGKGTQAERLRDVLGLLHLSTGEALRQAVSAGTPIGKRVQGVMDQGGLVPDDLVGEVVAEALGRGAPSSPGYVLDGFPRTLRQVEILDSILGSAGLGLEHAVFIDAPEPVLIRRVSGRRVCASCGAVYHVETKSPAKPGVCDACGGAVVQRADDREEVVAERLRVYREQTSPVVAAYGERSVLLKIDGTGSVDEVFALLRARLRG